MPITPSFSYKNKTDLPNEKSKLPVKKMKIERKKISPLTIYILLEKQVGYIL